MLAFVKTSVFSGLCGVLINLESCRDRNTIALWF